MELRQLKHFVAVAEELHFTRAAAKVHVVQSTLSASISSLEQELGTALLVRNNRRVDLTTASTWRCCRMRRTPWLLRNMRVPRSTQSRGCCRGG